MLKVIGPHSSSGTINNHRTIEWTNYFPNLRFEKSVTHDVSFWRNEMKGRIIAILLAIFVLTAVAQDQLGAQFETLSHRKAEISQLELALLKYQLSQVLYYKLPRFPSFESLFYNIKEQKLNMRFDIVPSVLDHYESKEKVIEMLKWVKDREIQCLRSTFPKLDLKGEAWLDIEFGTPRLDGQDSIASFRNGKWQIWNADALDPKKKKLANN